MNLIEDGENQAVRAFLQLYGCNNPTVAEMKDHMCESGFDGYWPEWIEEPRNAGHLTKDGAQSWIRYLFSIEPKHTSEAHVDPFEVVYCAINKCDHPHGLASCDDFKDWKEALFKPVRSSGIIEQNAKEFAALQSVLTDNFPTHRPEYPHGLAAWATSALQAQHNVCSKHPFYLEARLTEIVKWLEDNQCDVFERGIWDVINKVNSVDIDPIIQLPKPLDFISALQIAEGVFDQYRKDQIKWWKRMDGTPILNDIAVRMASAFVNVSKMEDN